MKKYFVNVTLLSLYTYDNHAQMQVILVLGLLILNIGHIDFHGRPSNLSTFLISNYFKTKLMQESSLINSTNFKLNVHYETSILQSQQLH